jgi:hypothetical protein
MDGPTQVTVPLKGCRPNDPYQRRTAAGILGDAGTFSASRAFPVSRLRAAKDDGMPLRTDRHGPDARLS